MDTSIGTRITVLRKSLGLTQKEFAERCEVRQATVSAWENDANLGAENIQVIIQKTGASAHWLLNNEGEMMGGPTEAELKLAELREKLKECQAIMDRPASPPTGRDDQKDPEGQQDELVREGMTAIQEAETIPSEEMGIPPEEAGDG